MNLFSAESCLIKLISLGRWEKVIVTELILHKTITTFSQLLVQCVLESEHFIFKETSSMFSIIIFSILYSTSSEMCSMTDCVLLHLIFIVSSFPI